MAAQPPSHGALSLSSGERVRKAGRNCEDQYHFKKLVSGVGFSNDARCGSEESASIRTEFLITSCDATGLAGITC